MFAELLSDQCNRSPAELQDDAASSFSAYVAKSNLRERRPSEPISKRKHVILGVASYSPQELELLDEIDANHARWKHAYTVYVFDVSGCQSMSDLERYLPGSQNVDQTPIVGVWPGNGRARLSTGLRATHDLLESFNLL